MNARRKISGGIVLAAAALLALSGCKKDEGEKVVLSAEFEQPAGGQKIYINDHSVRWTSGDAVRVNDAAEAVAVSDGAVEVTEKKNGYAVAYPFENSTLSGSGSACTGGTVVIPADQAYATTEGGQQILRSPMAARLDASSGRLYFKNLHSIIRVDVTTVGEAFALESITITSATANLAGTLGFTFTGGTTADAASAPELGSLTDAKKSVTLNFSEPLTLAAHTIDKAFYLCVAPFTNKDLEIKVTGRPLSGDNAGKKGRYVFNRSGKSLDRSIMAEVKADFGVTAFKPEPESFKFSVSAGLQVEFSPGNLQYCASSNTWRFAEHQYDFIGDAVGNTTAADNRASQTDWIDLFGWGTSGYADVRLNTEAYQPWTTSELYNAYWLNGSNNTSLSGKTDWGYNRIANGGNTENSGWRTLTNAEWEYLLGVSGEGRSSEHSDWWIYNMVKITGVGNAGVTGLIIYPDGVIAQPAGLSTKNNTNVVEITKANFEELEAMGCVFLPAAGYRSGTSVYYAGSLGNYWSSTCYGSYDAYSLSWLSGYVGPSNSRRRYYGQSVRLVKNVK